MFEKEARNIDLELGRDSKYYIPHTYGGYSRYVNVRDTKTHCLLPNCTSGAFGVFMQYMGVKNYDDVPIPRADAGNWYNNCPKLVKSKFPVIGAIACWRNAGKGHVGVVVNLERNENGDVIGTPTILESSYYSYNKKDWRCGKTYRYNANTGALVKTGYVFQGYLLNPNVQPDPVENQLKVGSLVEIVGSGNSRKDGKGKTSYGIGFNRYVLAVYPSAKYPYKVGNAKGVVTGYYGSDALKCKEEPAEEKLAVGDKVEIIGNGNSRKDGKGKVSGGIGWERYVLKIYDKYRYPYRIGTKKGVTTGYYQANDLKKL